VVTVRGQQFRSRVDTVIVDVLPMERGVVIANLRPEELEVRDNRTLQQITHVTGGTSALSIYLLLDTSGSLSEKDLQHLRRGAQSLAAALRPADELSLVTFSDRVRLHGMQTASALNESFDQLQPMGGTALNDALTAGFRLAERAADKRPVVITFSDGVDTTSWLTSKDVGDAARTSWSSLFAVLPRPRSAPLLEELADLTGGDVLKLTSDLSGLSNAFMQILERLRQRYLVAFTPSSSAPGWHELDVKVKRPAARVLARRGYLRR
jgi:VWFA-related protein